MLAFESWEPHSSLRQLVVLLQVSLINLLEAVNRAENKYIYIYIGGGNASPALMSDCINLK